MSFFKKCSLIAFRFVLLVFAYILMKFCVYKTYTVKRGVVVNAGYFKYRVAKNGFNYSYYPIVAFTDPKKNAKPLMCIDSIPSPFDEAGNIISPIGDIYFTQHPHEWHLNEHFRKGDSMDYYYKEGDITNARVLSLYSYWMTESAI